MKDAFVCTYQGLPNDLSVTGYSQPSWSSFDKRVWERETPYGTHRITLKQAGRRKESPRFILYEVVLDFGQISQSETGTNWQAMVKKAKEESCRVAPPSPAS